MIQSTERTSIPQQAIGQHAAGNCDGKKSGTFLRRLKLPGGQRIWKTCLILALVVGAAIVISHLSADSPEEMARRKLDEGDRLLTQGDVVGAARLFRDIAASQTDMAKEATERFRDLLETSLNRANLEAIAEVVRIALAWPNEADFRDILTRRGLEFLAEHTPANFRHAIDVLDLLGPVAVDRVVFLRERRTLLERWHNTARDDLALIDALALTYEQVSDVAAADRLLTPFEPQLGTHEGGRILGQIRLRQSKHEDSIRLLATYVDRHLTSLRQAVQGYQKAKQALAESTRKRSAEEFPYRRYERSTEEERRQIEWQYLHQQAAEDESLRKTLLALATYERVRGAVFDLGQAHLTRARAVAEPAQRDMDMAKAEELFLAVREIDGDRGDPRLRLAQVKFWLGRDADARRLIEEVLASENRDCEALLRASHLFQGIGASDDARKLLEEAYEKETDASRRHRVAELRAMLPADLEDRLRWLEHADPTAENVVGMLHSTRGYLAREHGRDQEAAEHLHKAVKLYDSLPRSPATLNNGGLACLALYTVNGDRAMLDKGVAMLEQAVALHPADTVLQSNTVDAVFCVALQDLLGKDIALDALRGRGRIEFLSFLYTDSTGRDQLAERIRNHAGFAKARTLAEKLILLAPRQPAGYSVLYSIHLMTRNSEGLRRLDVQLANANIDLSSQLRAQQERLAGRSDARLKEELGANTARLEKLCAQLVDGGRDQAHAVPCALLARALMQRSEVGLETDADRIVNLAEQAHKAVPSRMTRQTLVSTLFFRAHCRLIAENKPYAELARRTQRTLDAGTTLALALERNGDLKPWLAQDRDYRRGCELLRENWLALPDEPSPWAERLLRPVYPEEAERIVAAIKKDEIGPHLRSIALRLGPWNLAVALEHSWSLETIGRHQEVIAVLQRVMAAGVALPFQIE